MGAEGQAAAPHLLSAAVHGAVQGPQVAVQVLEALLPATAAASASATDAGTATATASARGLCFQPAQPRAAVLQRLDDRVRRQAHLRLPLDVQVRDLPRSVLFRLPETHQLGVGLGVGGVGVRGYERTRASRRVRGCAPHLELPPHLRAVG